MHIGYRDSSVTRLTSFGREPTRFFLVALPALRVQLHPLLHPSTSVLYVARRISVAREFDATSLSTQDTHTHLMLRSFAVPFSRSFAEFMGVTKPSKQIQRKRRTEDDNGVREEARQVACKSPRIESVA